MAKYRRIKDKVKGIVPEVGMGATIHVDRYVVPCTIIEVTTTDRRTPMVGVQVDRTGKTEFYRDEQGPVFLYTYRKTDRWIQYGHGFKSGPVLEIGIRRCKDFTDAVGPNTDAVSPSDADAVEDTVPNADAVGHAVTNADADADAVNDAVSPAERIRRMLG